MKNDKFKKILELLINEYMFLKRIVYRSSNQYRTNIRQRKAVLLVKLLSSLFKKNEIHNYLEKFQIRLPIFYCGKHLSEKERFCCVEELVEEISDSTETIYIYCSCEAKRGFNLPINYTVMAIVSRIKYLIKKLANFVCGTGKIIS